jgi:hypothetical protein
VAFQTIQKTGKFWKGFRALGMLAMVTGGVVYAMVTPTPSHFVAWSIGAGLAAWIFGRAGSLWHHG